MFELFLIKDKFHLIKYKRLITFSVIDYFILMKARCIKSVKINDYFYLHNKTSNLLEMVFDKCWKFYITNNQNKALRQRIFNSFTI